MQTVRWTREELKTRAKINLKKYYWAAFLVSLIVSIISGFGSGNSGGSSNSSDSASNGNGFGYFSNYQWDSKGEFAPNIVQEAPDIIGRIPVGGSGGNVAGLITAAVLGVALVFLILGIVLSIFVVPVMTVGKNRFYMESRGMGQSAGVGKIFWGFSNGYLNIVWTSFLKNLIVGLGFICCVIPGIYLSYCYYMVPYILSENPGMKPMEAMRLSKEMMEGHKFNTWVLELSFIGWILLGLLACCIGTWFVQPYVDATFAELYAVLRRPFGDRLNGFGVPDVVPFAGGYGAYVNPENVYDAGGQTGEAGAESAYDTEVTKAEGGPGTGYYLNGVFHPYTGDEK